jgi:alpha-tubulin suppressor-like RCC1 family protein
VTITGTNFVDVTSITLGGNEIGNRVVVSATELSGTTPASTSSGAKDVVVTSSSHGSGTCTGCFSYVPAPALAAVVAAGAWHVCAVANTGAAYCWGFNTTGQLGNGSFANSSVPVAVSAGLSFSALVAGAYHTCALTSSEAA